MDDRTRRTRLRDLDLGKALLKLILASVLLNGLILAAFLTSTPERSPASVWTALAYQARFRLDPVDPEADRAELARMHLGSADISTPECVACHGSMLDSPVAFHRIHLKNELIPGLECNDCHRKIDLQPRGNEAVVEWVDVGFCKRCHSAFPVESGSMTPLDFEIDCTMCHSGSHAFRHESRYLSQIIAPRECKGCHGGRVLPWDPLHEQADWLQVHGTEALRSGNKDCFACHDFGLKFCDTCHEKKPPSHSPQDRWKNVHREAARADTRACYTCHKLDFCRRCHLSHEEGWKEKHPSVVKSRGSKSCERCHSRSFCSYCHTDFSAGAEDTSTAP
ncbi:MAG TPA: hypothetical protein VLA05_05760 [Coriobacteriia bacterium]|nr:hypothetical protein [Coriobacteriia bacterium]